MYTLPSNFYGFSVEHSVQRKHQNEDEEEEKKKRYAYVTENEVTFGVTFLFSSKIRLNSQEQGKKELSAAQLYTISVQVLALENVNLKEKFCVTGEFYLKLLCKAWVMQNEFLLSISVL